MFCFPKPLKSALFLACFALAGCSMFGSHSLKPTDRIVFFGDSITYFGNQPSGYVSLVRDAVQKSDPSIEVIGAGIPGNKMADLLARIDKDVLAKKPTVVVIYIGINDVWHWRRNQGTLQEDFEAGLKQMIDKLQTAGARVILCTPTVIGEKIPGENKFDSLLDEYADITRGVAKERGLQLVDLRTLFKNYISKNNPDDLTQGVLTKDTVHLNPTGDRLVANQMLKAIR